MRPAVGCDWICHVRAKILVLREVESELCSWHELAADCGVGNRGIDRRHFFIQKVSRRKSGFQLRRGLWLFRVKNRAAEGIRGVSRQKGRTPADYRENEIARLRGRGG